MRDLFDAEQKIFSFALQPTKKHFPIPNSMHIHSNILDNLIAMVTGINFRETLIKQDIVHISDGVRNEFFKFKNCSSNTRKCE